MRIFDIENPVWSTLSKVLDAIILNLLFVLCCIPVITIGASLTALYYTSLRMVSGDMSYVSRDFFDSFKQNFKQSIPVEFVVFDAGVIISFVTWICFVNNLRFPKALCVVAVVLFAAVISYTFPILSKFNVSTGQLFRNSILMAVANIGYTVLNLILLGGAVLLIRANRLYIAIFLAFGCSLIAIIQSLWFNRIFKKYMSDQEKEIQQEFRDEEKAAKQEKKKKEAASDS